VGTTAPGCIGQPLARGSQAAADPLKEELSQSARSPVPGRLPFSGICGVGRRLLPQGMGHQRTVRDHQGHVVAGFAVTCPRIRDDAQRQGELIPMVVDAARQISVQMGDRSA